MDFSFFTTDNKSGYKTKESWVKKNEPKLYYDIITYTETLSDEYSFKERLWLYFHNQSERPKCLTCGSEVKFRNRLDKPYGDFCSLTCANNNKEELGRRQRKTLNEKYGVDYYPQHSEFVSKQKNTKQKKYGDPNYNNVNKSLKTKKLLYGHTNYNNVEKQKNTCLVKYGVDNYSKSEEYVQKLKYEYVEKYSDVNITDVKDYYVTIKCDVCNSESEMTKQLLYERHKRKQIICTECNPVGFSSRSSHEKELCDILDRLGINYQTNVKLNGIEYDVCIEDFKLLIEINGLYWHSDLFKGVDFHLNKTKNANNLGYKLIHVFEDEWLYRKEIVLSIISNKLNITTNKIYGRECTIKEINHDICSEFLENNHIQGSVKSSVRLGLFYGDLLVSVMSFSKGRVIMGGKPDEYELNRFCNLINYNVIGGSSKLLKHFEKTYKPKKIISYSDIRYFEGNMYEKLGFEWTSQSKPNYWYVMGTHRYHRFNFRKSILVKKGYDINLTESEIMSNNGVRKIYDCGNLKFVKKIN